MTTQSSLQLLFYEAQVRVQHLAQGHFSMQMGKTGDQTVNLNHMFMSVIIIMVIQMFIDVTI